MTDYSNNQEKLEAGAYSPFPQVRFLTTQEVAKILKVGTRSVGRYLSEQGLVGAKVGKRVLYRPEAVEAFVESRQVTNGRQVL